MEDEKELVLRAQKGDNAAFGALYDRYLPAIYRFILLKVGGRKGEAEDLTAEVFLSAWRNVGRFEFPAGGGSAFGGNGRPFSSWLYRIARNAVIDHYRTSKKNVSLETVPEEVFADQPETGERVDMSFAIARVQAQLVKLEPTYQDVLIMKFVEDMSNREIAAVLQKSEGAVRVIQHRALKQLKSKLEEA